MPDRRAELDLEPAGCGWATLLAGLRYDYFVENDSIQETTARNGVKTSTTCPEARAFAFSPRGGLTIQPLDWLVFFGNVSQTQTPTLGYVSADGTRPTDPWVATQEEGGVRIRPLEKLWFSASYYHIDQENMPQLDDANGNYYFAVRNLFDERYFDTSRHYYECFVGEPRTFEIGIRGRF